MIPARRRLFGLLLFGLLLSSALVARAGEVRVAVAANFAAPMQRIAQAFQRDTGHMALTVVGATGGLSAQIRNGAPFQVLLAADQASAHKLAQEGLAVAASRFTYATGRLALWSADPALVDANGDVLRTGRFDRLAMADPRLAPYGAAAREVLERLGLAARLQPRIVQGDSIAQAWQFVASGNAALGFVALAQVQGEGRPRTGSVWIVPQALHSPLRQDAVLLSPGQGQVAALAFMAWLRGEQARRIIESFSYQAGGG